MQNRQNNKPLYRVESDIKTALNTIENAPSETAATQAYHALKSHLHDYFSQAKSIIKQYYSQRDTITHQAQKLSDIELDFAIGEGQSDQPTAAPHPPQINFPEVLAVQNNPDFFFIRLSYGFINIRHIIELDVKAKTLYTSTGTRNLSKADTIKLIHLLKLYKNA